jgi:hypothetical protein
VPLPAGFGEIRMISECGSDRANVERTELSGYFAQLRVEAWKKRRSLCWYFCRLKLSARRQVP